MTDEHNLTAGRPAAVPDVVAPSTAIISREFPASVGDGCATVIALHGKGGDIDSFGMFREELTQSFDLVTPQAWRPVNVRMLRPEDDEGYCWYLDHGPQRPEPATFGDSLWQIEQFIYEQRKRRSDKRPLLLFGEDQGAVLALTIALILPDLVRGVVALDGFLPQIRSWSPPFRSAEGLSVLLLNSERPPYDAVAQGTVDELRSRGAALAHRLLPRGYMARTQAVDALNVWARSVLRLGDSSTSSNESRATAMDTVRSPAA